MTSAHFGHAEIVALRDGALGPAHGAQDHMAVCEACSEALERARERAAVVARALESLDREFDLEAARASVRARVARATAEAREEPRRSATLMPLRHLARAAGVLLVLAGAAAAWPGSPVRSWLAGGSESAAAPAAAPESARAAEAVAPQEGERALVRVAGGEGGVVVTLDGVAPGSAIEVRWVAGSSVGVLAAAGSSFSSAVGRIRASVAPGDVRVEMPREALSTLEVGGTSFLRRTAEGLELTGPVEERTDALVRFRMPGG